MTGNLEGERDVSSAGNFEGERDFSSDDIALRLFVLAVAALTDRSANLAALAAAVRSAKPRFFNGYAGIFNFSLSFSSLLF